MLYQYCTLVPSYITHTSPYVFTCTKCIVDYVIALMIAIYVVKGSVVQYGSTHVLHMN